MRSRIFFVPTLLACGLVAFATAADQKRDAWSGEIWGATGAPHHERSRCKQPFRGTGVTLPADDAVHPYTRDSIEWWYWTSHLTADDGRAFGFLDIVYTSLAEVAPGEFQPAQWSDTTVTDLSERAYHYGGREFSFTPASAIPNGFEFRIGNNRVWGGGGHDRVLATVDDGRRRYDLDLELVSLKTPVEQMADAFMVEYSRQRMATRGTVRVDGEIIPVRGFTHFDHQFGDQLVPLADVENWTWIALQLSDNRELVVLEANRHDGSQLAWAHLTDQSCNTYRYGPGQFHLLPTGSWKQSEGCEYPMGWQISIPAAHLWLTVNPVILDQDIFVPGMDHYYEGEATAVGFANGPVSARGVVELTWFCGF